MLQGRLLDNFVQNEFAHVWNSKVAPWYASVKSDSGLAGHLCELSHLELRKALLLLRL